VSDSDASSASWEAKLRRYQELGVRELVRFDWEETAERQLRIWDRVEGELVPRTDAKDRHLCRGLSLYWVVVPTPRHPATLRLARDAEGRDLVGRDPWLTPEETKARVREAEARIREAEARGREAAEQRVAELEAQLRLRKG
jgi:hypothetical protein